VIVASLQVKGIAITKRIAYQDLKKRNWLGRKIGASVLITRRITPHLLKSDARSKVIRKTTFWGTSQN